MTGTVKQFSRLPRYDRFDNPPCIKTALTVNTEIDIQLKDERNLQERFLARCRENRQKPSHHKGFWIHSKQVNESFSRAFHAACEAADIEKRGLHSLRKLFCKTLKDLPVEWEQVRSIMGHESIWVTQQYYYAMDNDEISEIAIKLSKKS